MKIIVLHNRFNNEPIIVRVNAINAVQKRIDIDDDGNKEEYTGVLVGYVDYDVKEHIDVVMRRINALENKHISRKEREIVNEDKNCNPIRF